MSRPLSPYEGLDLHRLVAARAAARGDSLALAWEPFEGDPRTWTYSNLYREACAVAAGLAARGVRRGQRVMIHLENCPEFVLAWLGCGFLGAVAVTTNTRSADEELAYFAAHSAAVGAITQPAFAEALGRVAPNLQWIAVTNTDAGRPPAQAVEAGARFAALIGDPDAFSPPQPDPWASFAIQYTSGTTARPKAVLWTHGNALWGGQASAAHEGLTADDVHLVSLPLFHTNAQSYSLLAALWAGAAVVLQPRFSASRFWEVSVRRRCTWASLIPFCSRALAQQPRPAGHHYRLWGNAVASPAAANPFGIETLGWWGMTETVTHGLVTTLGLPATPRSMGRPARGYEIRIVDADGRDTAPGETGDLLIRGRRGVSLFAGYVGDPEATAAAFDPEGWFRTGDRVWRDAGGDVVFADRAKDMLKVGGENVAASEIERVIGGVPGVREVAVVGRRDPMLGETPFAFVIADPAQPTALVALGITAACEAALAPFKRPSDVRFVADLPRANLEKVAKARLRELANTGNLEAG